MTTQLAGRSHMSSSVNNKSFLWWIYFEPLINFWLFPFFLWSPAALETLRMLLPHRSRMSSSQNDKCFLFLDFFTNWFFIFFIFDPLPLKRWRRCWLMGPRCQPPRTRNMWYFILQTINVVFRSELLQTDKLNLYININKLICWISLFFVFAKHRTFLFFFWEKSELSCSGVGWNCTSQKAQKDSSKAQMSRSSPIEIFIFLDFFHPLISGYFIFLLVLCRLGNVETAAAKWDPHVILDVQ